MDVSGTEALLIQIHLGIAAFTVPEMALEQEEAHQLAEALATLEKHYGFNPLSEKHMALLAFAGVAVRVYGPRVPAIMRGRPKKDAAKPEPRNVTVEGVAAPIVAPSEVADAAPWFTDSPPSTGMN